MRGFFSQQGTWSGIVPWVQQSGVQSETPVHKKSGRLGRVFSHLKDAVETVFTAVETVSTAVDTTSTAVDTASTVVDTVSTAVDWSQVDYSDMF
jgi:hypothetical protein